MNPPFSGRCPGDAAGGALPAPAPPPVPALPSPSARPDVPSPRLSPPRPSKGARGLWGSSFCPQRRGSSVTCQPRGPRRALGPQLPPAPQEQVPGLLVGPRRSQPPATRAEVGPRKGAQGSHMESGGGTAPAGALGAAAESPQCPLPPGGEGAAAPAEPDGAAEGVGGGGEGGPQRALRAVYVRSESPQGGTAGGPEAGARQCLLRACEAEGAHLTSVPFGELDFGETAVLDAFYDAGEAGASFAPTLLLPAFLILARAPVPPPPPS